MGFYILSFKEEALSLNHLNRAIRFIAISYMYHPDENTNKSHNLNAATRPNVLYQLIKPCIYIQLSIEISIEPDREFNLDPLRILSSGFFFCESCQVGFFLLPLTQICVFCTLQYEQQIKTEGVLHRAYNHLREINANSLSILLVKKVSYVLLMK